MWNYQGGGAPPFPHILGTPVPPPGRPPGVHTSMGQGATSFIPLAQPPQFFGAGRVGMQQGPINYNQPPRMPGMQAAFPTPPQPNMTSHPQMPPAFQPMQGGGLNAPRPLEVSGSHFHFQMPNAPAAPPHTPTGHAPMFHRDRLPSTPSVQTPLSESFAGKQREQTVEESEVDRWLREWRGKWCPAGSARTGSHHSGGDVTEEQLQNCPVPAAPLVLTLYRDLRAQKHQLEAVGPNHQVDATQLEQLRLLQARLDEAMGQLRLDLASYKCRKQRKKAYRQRSRAQLAVEREGEAARLQRAHARADEWLATRRNLIAEMAKAGEARQLARVRSKHVGYIGDELGAWEQLLDGLLQLRQARHTNALKQGYVPSTASEDSAFHSGLQQAQGILAQAQSITETELGRLHAERDQQDANIKEMQRQQERVVHTVFGSDDHDNESFSTGEEGGIPSDSGEDRSKHTDADGTHIGGDSQHAASDGTTREGQPVVNAGSMDEYQRYWRQAELSAEALNTVRSSWAAYKVPDGQTAPASTDGVDPTELLKPGSPSNASWVPYLKVAV